MKQVHILWLSEGFEGSEILTVYDNLTSAEEHCDRLNSMTTFLDECSY